jgi:Protein of unknown function (DUF1553)/Protein of unknown function (DUF1549)/Concanavalin A-like lectin/glucanases superfamily/Planctomycete cytochrome C
MPAMKFAPAIAALLILNTNGFAADGPPTIRFGRDILPILSHNCFQCHGPDEKARKAKLRLDTNKGALSVVVPGKSGDSELIRRINEDADELMPPPRTNRKLTAEQKETLRRWIDEGAVWGKHWAYEAVVRPSLPPVKDASWPRNPIDHFIIARLAKEKLTPAPEAARETLIRRVTLDLTGLPPTPHEVDAFVADRSPDAYEKVVDRLLASPRYGECMALEWLDEARFADTNGYQNDFARTMWPWRDGVIVAFNQNQPFDRFVVEQIAGDLLPHATLAQKIASGFNRNNRTVTEAGSIEEEWRVENAVDRVETTATVFLGLTMGCCRCHDHKYDPIGQKEFYQFFAFFNSLNEQGVYTEQRGNVPPLVTVVGQEDQKRMRQLDEAIAAAEQTVQEQEKTISGRQQAWEKEQQARPASIEPSDWVWHCSLNGDLHSLGADGKKSELVFRGKGQPVWSEGPVGKALKLDGMDTSFLDAGQAVVLDRTDKFSYGGWIKANGDGALLSKIDDSAAYRGFDLLLSNGKVDVHLVHNWPDNALKVTSQEPLARDAWVHVFVTHDGSGKAAGLKLYVNGRPVKLVVQNDKLRDTLATKQPLRVGKRSTSLALRGEAADIRVYRRLLTGDEVQAIAAQPLRHILQTPMAQRSKVQKELLSQVFREQFASELRVPKDKAAKLRKEKTELEKSLPTVMVMEELKTPRETFVLKRGRYDMPDKGQKVDPGVPACLPPWPADAPRNRLGLARWLVSPDNPLTARVRVNRYWQHHFGIGLVKTADNFGIQGELPSHPELLDYLASEFVRTGWNVKAMHRLMVTSATYRESSRATAAALHRDPENRLLARGPRFRLSAEVVRDNALDISGLLVEKVGGPSIKPYQPAGLWEELAGGAGEGPYVQEKGAGLYRRSLYIYRKRTVPHPSMATFDAPSREVCQVKRPRTNTPLQARQLLNDVTYVEAARRLGQLMLTEGGRTPEERLAFAFRRSTARTPGPMELQVLLRGLERHQQNFRGDKEAAQRFLRHGDSPLDAKLDAAELAAYAAMAGVILNLDETITRE